MKKDIRYIQIMQVNDEKFFFKKEWYARGSDGRNHLMVRWESLRGGSVVAYITPRKGK